MCKLAKSVLNVFLSVVLALSLVPSFVHAGSDAKGGARDFVVNEFYQFPYEVNTPTALVMNLMAIGIMMIIMNILAMSIMIVMVQH